MKRKILLVEDEAIIAMSTAKMMEKLDYKVETVFKGEKAVEAVREDQDISLILMDIDLGKGMDGTETAQEVLKVRELPAFTLPFAVSYPINRGYILLKSIVFYLDFCSKKTQNKP